MSSVTLKMGFWQNTDPLIDPYKINGKIKLKQAQNYQWHRFMFSNKYSLPDISNLVDEFQISDSLLL